MSDQDLTELTIAEASALIADGSLSPVALTEAYLARIADVDPELNAYTTLADDRARKQAEQAEEELSHGVRRGPLHGIPIGLKDLIDTADVRTTSGSALRRDHFPEEDATVAAKLRAGGAVLLGKHATHEWAWGGTTNNPHFGPTRNPHDAERVPGGSSGGSAASVVARTSLASVGTDTCGSVRIPAALCGCVGLKPTYGRISLTGVTPLGPSFDHVGPITRTVADAALMYELLAGADPTDERTGRLPAVEVPVLGGDVTGVRVRRLLGWAEAIIDPAVRAGVDRAAAALGEIGAVVEAVEMPDQGPLVDRIFTLVHAEAEPWHRAAFGRDASAFGPDLTVNLSRPPADPVTLARVRAELASTTDWLMARLEDAQILMLPTVPALAPRIGTEHVEVAGHELHVEWMLTRLTSLFNLTGLPAITLPGRAGPGLPVGVQLVARHNDEATLLRVADALERAMS
ncbi:MAG TPA: amidase [Actinomadura sp.]|jgi:aspartyl-tRNA(Asn)/glutamyl-tRNA(Gln) amidotransferase subunit A|nr:amidase [Actinomadura sp.]